MRMFGFRDLHTVGVLGASSIRERLTGLAQLGIEVTPEVILQMPAKDRPKELRSARERGHIVVDPPYTEAELVELVGDTSVDLEMGGKLRIHSNPHEHPVRRGEYLETPVVDLTVPETVEQIAETDTLYELDNRAYVLTPGAFVKTITLRCYFMPYDLLGWVTGRSSVGRWGITTTVDAPGIDPGFSGPIVLEIAHIGTWPFALRKGLAIAQMRFLNVEGKMATPYDERHETWRRQSDVQYAVAPQSPLFHPWPEVIGRGVNPPEEE